MVFIDNSKSFSVLFAHQSSKPDNIGKPACRQAGMMEASWRD
jgi:hypothetical protein